MTAARDWYEARDAAGEVVFEFTAGAGTVFGVGILPKRGTALDGVAYGAAPAVRAALEAGDFGAACDALRAHGLSVERVPDLSDVQVRISATGHPFTPGHKGGVGAHGEIGGKLSAASKALKEVSDSVAQAKQHAFLAGKAADHASAAKHAADALHATKKAEAGLAAVAKHGTKQQAAHAADLVKGARVAHTEAHAHADAKKTVPTKVPAPAKDDIPAKAPKPPAQSDSRKKPVTVSQAQANKFGAKHYGEWVKSLNPSEREAITHYTSADFQQINGGLRAAGGDLSKVKGDLKYFDGKVADTVRHLDAAMAKSPGTPVDMVVHRKFRSGPGIDVNSWKVGGTFKEHGFMSTEVSGHVAATASDVQVYITAPKGTKGAFLAQSTIGFSGGHEFLLPRGTTLRIDKIKSKNGRHVVHATVVQS